MSTTQPADLRTSHYLAIILSRWRRITGLVATAFLSALILGLLLPETYTARAVLLPPPEDPREHLLASVGEFGELPRVLRGGNQEIIERVLRSRSVADSIIAQFDLGKMWGVDGREAARKILAEHVTIQSEPDGSISIQYQDRDPQRAARVTNAYPHVLNLVNARVGMEFAAQKATILEKQLSVVQKQLVESEIAFVEFQREHKALEVQEQARQTIEVAAGLQQAIIEKEIELAQLQRLYTGESPRLRSAYAELGALRDQLGRLTGGQAYSDALLSFGEVPELGVHYARLVRDYTKNLQILLSLSAFLAQARIDASSRTPVVSVLDPAVVPEKPSAPRPLLLASLTGLFALIAGCTITLAAEMARRARRDPDKREFFAAWDRVKGDMRSYFRGWGTKR